MAHGIPDLNDEAHNVLNRLAHRATFHQLEVERLNEALCAAVADAVYDRFIHSPFYRDAQHFFDSRLASKALD
jgi:hypothetical protein